MWPGNSDPSRGRSPGPSGHAGGDTEQRLTEMVAAAEKRTHARLLGIEQSLAVIQRSLAEDRGSTGKSVPAARNRVDVTTSAPAPSSLAYAGSVDGGLSRSLPPPAATVFNSEEQQQEMRMRRLGTITVHLKYARDLIKADFGGLSDPYVVAKIFGQPAKRTKTKKNTLNPEWDERLEFDCELGVAVAHPLVLEVFDEDFVVVGALLKGVGRRASTRDSCCRRESAATASARAALDDRRLLTNNKDDKLGKLPAVSLDGLATANTIDFDGVRLQGVRSGTITFAVSWTEAAETDTQVRALVDRDPEVRNLLKDMRRQMDLHAQRDVQLFEAWKGQADDKKNKSPGASGSPGVKSFLPAAMQRSKTRDLTEPEPSVVGRVLRRKSSDLDPRVSTAIAAAGLGDPSEDDAVVAHPTSLGSTCQKLCHYLCGPVLHPDSRFRAGWNVGLAAFIIYCGISVPLEIAFDTDMGYAMCGRSTLRENCANFLAWFWLNFAVDIFFIVDIVINFRTGYINEGFFVEDDYLAAMSYLRGAFLMDLLGSLPINIVIMIAQPENPFGNVIEGEQSVDVTRINRTLRMLRMMKILKLFRIRKLASYAQNFEDFINPAVISIAKLVIVMILCCHWFGCLWWLVSEIEADLEDHETGSGWNDGVNAWRVQPWLKAADDQFGMKYAHAFLWGASMVTAIVPYDVMPVTALENWVTTLAMFFGLIFNAVVISSLTTALTSMNSKKELSGKQLDTIRNYLYVKAVPNDLRSRILEYYEYLFTSSQALAKSIS